ncbi:hypothetical protein RhiirA1_413363 [Rhizophagus irregularis]|uniref:Uncharacterized protein n=1 Tax=Rhizophagus irregularis TaxID=588596 RepID=A0A2I1ER49_9GLOM|nr:hypothetical protein RhiirA1_413363 [Rhizophagus irregularis]PKY24591.1 hypothetical protein RhiirB3_413165 [Rhizophagus irregularis]
MGSYNFSLLYKSNIHFVRTLIGLPSRPTLGLLTNGVISMIDEEKKKKIFMRFGKKNQFF